MESTSPYSSLTLGPIRSDGQVGADVAELLAQLVEELRHFAGRRVVLEFDLHRREGRLGVGRDLVEVGQLLQLLLDRVRDLILHFLRGGARPDRGDDRDLDGEVRILGAPELEVGEGACRRQHQDHEQHQRRVLDGPGGKIEAAHHRSPKILHKSLLPAVRQDPATLARRPASEIRTAACRPRAPSARCRAFGCPSATIHSPSATPPFTSTSRAS